MLQSHSQQTNQISLFSKDSFYSLNSSFTPVFHRLFLIFNNTELNNIWSSPGIDPEKACERERIHLMSKRRLRKKL